MKDASISALDSSTLASIRYRLAPMAKASAALGYHVSIGDRVPAEIDILIVGKIEVVITIGGLRYGWTGYGSAYQKGRKL